jgi:hypothetical protein
VIDTTADESGVNPNDDFLDGKRCPECGSYGPFEIVVSRRVMLYDEGPDAEDGTTEYDDDSPATCHACGHDGKFGDFDE